MQIKRISSKANQQAEDEKRQGWVKIVGVLLLLILAISSIGYAFISSEDNSEADVKIEEGKIVEQNGRWFTILSGRQISFSSSLESVQNITDTSKAGINDYYQQNLYYVDANDILFSEFSQNIGLYALKVQPACYGSCELDLPEKNCSDNLIIWNRTAVENRVYQEDNCVFIDGDIRSVNAFLYRVFGLKK